MFLLINIFIFKFRITPHRLYRLAAYYVPAEVEKAEEEEDRPLAMMARILIREAMDSRKRGVTAAGRHLSVEMSRRA
jgi:hypothetical protein